MLAVAVLAAAILAGAKANAADAPPAPAPKVQSPYAAWKNGPPPDPNFFPLAVWLQDPKNAARFKAEVWMSLVHGSTGLIWFVHEFQPKFKEAALLDDPEMLAAVTAINKQIRDLAPVLHAPGRPVTVFSSAAAVTIDALAKQFGGATYVFAVGMRNAAAKATFEVRGLPATATAEVIGEDRRIEVKDGRFDDAFAPYAVHLYRIAL